MILIIGLLSWLRGSNYFVWLIILLCPILHIWMMRWMMKKHRDDDSFCKKGVNQKSEYYKCPECGLEYKEKSWAEKCETWCKKHKSCNLEITKYAFKNLKGQK